MLDDCRKYLSGHPGTPYFACGTLNPHWSHPANDRDFDVALHVIFDSRNSHDDYQDSAIHHQFIDENKPNWRLVRVFDADVNV